MSWRPWAVLPVLLALVAPLGAQTLVTEVFPIGYRDLGEVISVLRPLVSPPGAVTGMGSQLVVRTTPENLRAIKAVLARLDHPPRRLLISVRREDAEHARDYGHDLAAELRAGDLRLSTRGRRETGPGITLRHRSEDLRARLHAYDERVSTERQDVQQLQVLDGHEAYIRTGRSVPLAQRSLIAGRYGARIADTITYRDLTSGFYVRPRVNGDRVTLSVSPHSARIAREHGGAIELQEASTVVSGRLGEWLLVAGVQQQASEHGEASSYASTRHAGGEQVILLKVDELP